MKIIVMKNKIGHLLSPKIDCPIGTLKIFTSDIGNDINKYYYGTWERFGRGKTLVGVDESDLDFKIAGQTGGEKTHKTTIDELPEHNHGMKFGYGTGTYSTYNASVINKSISQTVENTEILSTGGSKPHNNLQPYITVYFYVRVS